MSFEPFSLGFQSHHKMPLIRGKYLACGIDVVFKEDPHGMEAAKKTLPSESHGKFRWCGNVLTVYDEEIWTLLGLPPRGPGRG